MKDHEINLAIAKIEHPEAVREGTNYVFNVDYVNNWQDIGPIIEREKIEIVTFGWDGWLAMRNEKARAETPTKAAALCYLKMKGVIENEHTTRGFEKP
jgi:hypothetical protein